MAAYVVANYTITNHEAFGPYPPAAQDTLAAHGAEIVAVDLNSEAVEGNPGQVTVILKFASKAAMRAWYDSPEYREIINLRTGNTENGSMVLLETA